MLGGGLGEVSILDPSKSWTIRTGLKQAKSGLDKCSFIRRGAAVGLEILYWLCQFII